MTETLFAGVLETRGYVVGQANAPSGLHRYEGGGRWTHRGWRNVRCFGLAFDPSRPATLFLAAGNGVFRSLDGGATWRITTGWQITEVLDVTVDPHHPATVYAATAYGVWRSPDRGDTWREANDGIPTPAATFTPTIEADHNRRGRLVVGSEAGLFQTTDGGATWQHVGPVGVPIRAVHQHAVAPDLWLAGAEDHGALLSVDGGKRWRRAEGAIAEATLYAVALDPSDPQRLAAAGYRTGIYASTDGGKKWRRPPGSPNRTVHALAFDPGTPGRLWIGTVGDGVFYTDDLGRTWTHAGLPDATVWDLAFAEGQR